MPANDVEPDQASRHADLGPLLLLGFSLLIVQGELLGTHTLDAPTTLKETFPLISRVGTMLHTGAFSLFNRFNFLGHSLAGLPQAQTAYPPALALAYLFPPQAALGLGLVIHHAFLLLFTYAFARNLGLGRGAGAMAALAFGYSGPVIGRADDLAGLCTLAYLPILLTIATFAREPDDTSIWLERLRWVSASACTALMLLAGDPGTACVVLVAFVLVSVATARQASREDAASLAPAARGPMLAVAAALVLAAGGLAPWFLTPIDPEVSRRALAAHSVPAAMIPTLLVPFAFGSGHRLGHVLFPRGGPWGALAFLGLIDTAGPWFGPGDFGPGELYIGLVPLLLLALLGRDPREETRHRRRLGIALWRTAAVAFLLALGVRGPLAPLWRLIPERIAPCPWTCAAVMVLAIVLRAAQGLDALLATEDKDAGGIAVRGTVWRTTAILGVGIAICVVGWKLPEMLQRSVYVRGFSIPDRRYELWPEHLRQSQPDLLQVVMGHCALWGLWAGALALLLRALLHLRRRAVLAAGPLAFYIALLTFTDQGLMFARRAWGHAVLGHNPAEGSVPAPINTPSPFVPLLGLQGPPRILIHAPDDAFAPGPASMVPPVPGGPLAFRTGLSNLLDPVSVVGGPDALVPAELRRLFGHWPPDPVEDWTTLSLVGVGGVASAVPLSSPRLEPLMLEPRMRPVLRFYRTRPQPGPATIVRKLAPLARGASAADVLASIRSRIAAVVIDDPREGPIVAAGVTLPGESVAAGTDASTQIEWRVFVSSRAYLVLPFRFDPDVVLMVNGMPARLISASGLAAAALDPGLSTVHLDLAPGSEGAGRAVNLAGFLLWLAWAALTLLGLGAL